MADCVGKRPSMLEKIQPTRRKAGGSKDSFDLKAAVLHILLLQQAKVDFYVDAPQRGGLQNPGHSAQYLEFEAFYIHFDDGWGTTEPIQQCVSSSN